MASAGWHVWFGSAIGRWEGSGLTHQGEGSGCREAQLQCLVSAPMGSRPLDNAYLTRSYSVLFCCHKSALKRSKHQTLHLVGVLCDTDPQGVTCVSHCCGRLCSTQALGRSVGSSRPVITCPVTFRGNTQLKQQIYKLEDSAPCWGWVPYCLH